MPVTVFLPLTRALILHPAISRKFHCSEPLRWYGFHKCNTHAYKQVEGETPKFPSGPDESLDETSMASFSYLINRIESRVYMVVVCENSTAKRNHNAFLATELTGLTQKLRLIPVFALLRPKYKKGS